MNICYISTFPPEMCGIGTYTNYLTNALLDIDDGISVTVLARKGGEQRKSERLTVIPSFSAGDYTDVLINLRHLRADIIHIQHEFGLFPAEENFLKFLKEIKANKYPLILTLHTVYATHTLNMPGIDVDIEEYNCKIGDIVDCEIVHLDRPLRRVLLRMGIAKEKLEIIPHGTKLFALIDSYQAKERLGLPAGKLILSFGFISKGKNQLSLIEALPLILKNVSDAYLFIAGYSRVMDPDDLSYIKLCKEKARELNIEDRVIFSDDFIAEKDLPLVFSAADCCCYLYNEENRSGSGAIHIALGSGRPIIASRIPKFEEELMKNVSDEILCLPNNIEAIAEITVRILNDKKFTNAIVRSIRKYAIDTSWEEIAKKHLILYQRFL
ncbi:MAG: glycosyltransferase [Deltaproteobacteria bacterium]|nr:glycosyltransferase [Deltaproteobacteria bacterium]